MLAVLIGLFRWWTPSCEYCSGQGEDVGKTGCLRVVCICGEVGGSGWNLGEGLSTCLWGVAGAEECGPRALSLRRCSRKGFRHHSGLSGGRTTLWPPLVLSETPFYISQTQGLLLRGILGSFNPELFFSEVSSLSHTNRSWM